MNERQARFVDEYIKTGNATQAYINAGYSPRGADGHAARLVGNGRVAEAIEAHRRELELTAGIERKHILGILLKIASQGDTDGAKVQAVRELNKMLGYHEPLKVQDVTTRGLQVHVHYIEAPGGNGRR